MNTSSTIGFLAVPPLAVGTMYFGTTVSPQAGRACLDAAFETGARLWDTANNYAFWAGGVGDESETVLGDWFAANGATARNQVVLATKIGARPARPGAGLQDVLGLSRAAVRPQLIDSLRRLRTDYVDLLYAHVDDPHTDPAETLGALSDLVDEGLVRHIAASNLAPDRLEMVMGVPAAHRYMALQQRFTYLIPAPGTDLGPHVLLDEPIEDLAARHGLTLLGYLPLLSGAYTRGDRPLPEGYDTTGTPAALATLAAVAQRHRLDAGQTVLAWMTQRARPVLPVVGASRPEHVSSAWTAVHTTLAAADVAALDRARRG